MRHMTANQGGKRELKQNGEADKGDRQLPKMKRGGAAVQMYKVISESLPGDLVTDVSPYSPGHAHTLLNMRHDKRNCTNCSFTSPHAV